MKTKYKIQIAKTISFFLKPFFKKNQIHIRNKIKWMLDLNEGIDLSIFLFGTSEKKIENLKQIFKSNTKLTIIDIGAPISIIVSFVFDLKICFKFSIFFSEVPNRNIDKSIPSFKSSIHFILFLM